MKKLDPRKEILSDIKERPETPAAWWVLWTGLLTLVVGPLFGLFTSFLRMLLDPASVNPGDGLGSGISGVFLTLALSITTVVLFVRNYKLGERSWVLWAGLIPAALAGSFWVYITFARLVVPR